MTNTLVTYSRALALWHLNEQWHGIVQCSVEWSGGMWRFHRNYSPIGGRKYWTEQNAKWVLPVPVGFVDTKCRSSSQLSSRVHLILPRIPGQGNATVDIGTNSWELASSTSRLDRFERRCFEDVISADLMRCSWTHPTHRQYSKHYFPLNVLAMSPVEQEKLGIAKGKTGIPLNCYLSPFSSQSRAWQKRALVELLKRVTEANIGWVFLSFSNQSIAEYGQVGVHKTEHKRYQAK